MGLKKKWGVWWLGNRRLVRYVVTQRFYCYRITRRNEDHRRALDGPGAYFIQEKTMKKAVSLTFLTLALSAAAYPLHAQNGCLDSPDNPTAVLAIVGVAGVYAPCLKNRGIGRRTSTRKEAKPSFGLLEINRVSIVE